MTRRIDAWAERWPHYLTHLAPIWEALPEGRRGTFWVGRQASVHAQRLGIDARVVAKPPPSGVPVLVAGWPGGWRAPGRPICLIEHGVGQPYQGVTHEAHPGGERRHRIGLYLCPNQAVAARNLAAYPDATVAVVGAPHLDRWHRASPSRPSSEGPKPEGPIVVSWHFDSEVCPEASSAWPHYGPAALDQLRATFGDRLRGHAHPRLLPRIRHFYDQAHIPVIDHFTQVLDTAAIYACDNSSTLFEAASVGIPVVAMNAPWYRRHVHHGLRFWDTVPGPQVDHPDQLAPTITQVLTDPASALASGRVATAAGYVACDGHATTRAVDAITRWLDALPGGPTRP